MKTKIYLNDWFYNCGIVGFLRVLEHNDDNFANMQENYIIFDTKDLKNFHKYYFKYFFDKYNVCLKIKDRLEKSVEKIENYLKLEMQSPEEIKRIQEYIELEKKYIKEIIKQQLDRIKKYDKTIYENILKEYNKIDNVNVKIKLIEKFKIKLIEFYQFF